MKPVLFAATALLVASDFTGVVKSSSPGVFLLSVFDDRGQILRTGTGFTISSDGRLITNRHVIEGAIRIEAKAGNGGRFLFEGVLAEDVGNDLVILKLEGKDFKALQISKAPVKAGQKVLVIGSPLGLSESASEGIVSSTRENGVLQITAPVSPGSSGSPVFAVNGTVVGVATSQLKEGQAINFAIPAVSIQELSRGIDPGKKPLPLTGPPKPISEEIVIADADFQLCASLFESGKGREALPPAQRLVEKFPKSAAAHLMLGRALSSLRLHQEALLELQSAIKMNPSNAEIWAYLGVTYSDLGRGSDSTYALEQSYSINPRILRGFTGALLGLNAQSQRKFAEARAYFETVLRIREGNEIPSDAHLYSNLLHVYCELGEFGLAEELIPRIQKLDPSRGSIERNYLRFKRGR